MDPGLAPVSTRSNRAGRVSAVDAEMRGGAGFFCRNRPSPVRRHGEHQCVDCPGCARRAVVEMDVAAFGKVECYDTVSVQRTLAQQLHTGGARHVIGSLRDNAGF